MEAPTASRRPAQWWTDRSIRTKGLVVLAVPIAILLVVLASTAWFTHVNDRAQTVGGRVRQALTLTNDLDRNVLRADNAVRGHLLYSGSSYMGAYDAAVSAVPRELASVGPLVQDNASQRRALSDLTRATDATMSDLAGLVAQPSVSTPAAQALVRRVDSDQAAVQSSGARLEAALNAEQLQQHQTVHNSNTDLLLIAITAAVLAVGGGIALTQLFTSGVTRRLRALEKATSVLEEGGPLVDVPSGNDEIGRLSNRILSAASQLRDRADERDGARRQLEDILTASPVVSLRYEVATRTFSYASPNVERLLGLSAETAVAHPDAVIERFHPDGARRLREALVEVARRRHARMLEAAPNGANAVGEVPAHARGNGTAGRTTDSESDPRRAARSATKAALPGERVEITLRFRRDPESTRWGDAEAIYTLEYDDADNLIGVVAYLVDASERHSAQRAAEERRSMLETIFHASPDTIVVRDVAGRIILASSALADVIGVGQRSKDRTGEFVDSATAFPTVNPQDRRLLESLTTRCLAGEPTPDPVVTTIRLPGGERQTFETRARAVLDALGHVIGTVTVSRDITDRTRLEHSLRKASDEAARASDAKSEFLSRMSHELRTPLNAILGFTQLLELDEPTGEQAVSLDQIQKAGRHLLSLINEVLDISRIEAGRLSLSAEPIPVGDVLDEVTALLMPTAESADLQLSVMTEDARDLFVRADRQRLLQVLLNLGSNALKYNERGGSVSFRTWETSSGMVRFEVSDTGPGIPVEKQDQLFVPFSRLGAERSTVEGTGVGLALSKQLVELMGGSIGVDSLPGHGSTFWVDLHATRLPTARRAAQSDFAPGAVSADEVKAGGPSAAESPLAAGGADGAEVELAGVEVGTQTERGDSATEAATNGTEVSTGDEIEGGVGQSLDPTANGGREDQFAGAGTSDEGHAGPSATNGDRPAQREIVVLQIEDNTSNASLVEQVLSRRPAVRLVSSTEAAPALELARAYHPALILLDLHLPDMSGEELLYRLKAVPELADTKVVVVSADATPGRIRRVLELGVEGYLTKPVDVEALLRLVDLEIALAGHPSAVCE